MTLITTCPSCQTSFRIVPDQLKLRQGLVRCGACHTVFSGSDFQHRTADSSTAGRRGAQMDWEETSLPGVQRRTRPQAPVAAIAPTPAPVGESPLERNFDANPVTVHELLADPGAKLLTEPAAEPAAEPVAEPVDEPVAEPVDEPVAQPVAQPVDEPVDEPVAESVAELQTEAVSDAQQEDAIDFFATGAERRFGWLPRTWIGRALGLLLALSLAMQLVLGGRDWIAARYPQTRTLLEELGRPLGLKIELPRRLEAVTIEAELVSVEPPGSYRLNALLRSRADTALQWPAIELTLTDATGAIVTRRVLNPKDFIADPSIVAQGLPAGSERTIRIGLEFGGPAPTGYAAQLFYP